MSEPFGNMVFVDAVFGNDTTGLRQYADKPFLTIAAALAVALPGDYVHVGPGSYPIVPFVMPVGVTLAGSFPLRTTLTRTIVGDETLITMSNNSVVRTLRVQGSSAGHHTMTCFHFPSTLGTGDNQSAFIQDVHAELDNSGAGAGTSVMTGVRLSSPRIYNDYNTLFNCTVHVHSAGATGAKRGVLTDGVGSFNIVATHINLVSEGLVSTNSIGLEATNAASVTRMATGTIKVTGGVSPTTNADISATAGAPGSLRVGCLLSDVGGTSVSGCRGIAFTPINQLGTMVFSDSGNMTAAQVFLQAGGDSAGTGNEAVAQFRIARPCIVQTMSCKLATAPTGVNTLATTLRKSGAATALTTTITGPGTTATDLTHAVEYASGADLAIDHLGSAAGAGSGINLQVTVEMSSW
jgi:hypothetical protein